MKNEYTDRRSAIHLLRSGNTPTEVARLLGRSRSWVYKWQARFGEPGQWVNLKTRSRAPHHCPTRLPADVRQAIGRIRSELEEAASRPGELTYIGGPAIQAKLRQARLPHLPSVPSIERILAEQGLTRPRGRKEAPAAHYPHLDPQSPLELIQVDILPHFLPGGASVACFNAIDVVSRYPTGAQRLTKRSTDAANFLIQVWQELGIPAFTQIDNESCFCGGTTHPGVVGKVVRLALYVGAEVVFSPFYYPQSNGHIERFHQDYDANTWQKSEMSDLTSVHTTSQGFFGRYRGSQHIASLKGRCPEEIHFAQAVLRLPESFTLPDKLPVTVGQVHFIRQITADQRVSILNLSWTVPDAQPLHGVWATLTFSLSGATLRVYDQAPDAAKRSCLVEYPFPLKEPVQPLLAAFQKPIAVQPSWFNLAAGLFRLAIQKRLPHWLSSMF